ncbi:PREDICTED: filamin-B-like [Gekko japonicus]|uniref:Filamin-B-like n=1 Tax=Gekko japonicus TaxID=146911 RepID=A0ABM1LAP1_GEKJA|nr:PREDICTED: filamin-B-like [Gekko japonicus]
MLCCVDAKLQRDFGNFANAWCSPYSPLTSRHPFRLLPSRLLNLPFLLPGLPSDKYAVRFIPRENGIYSVDVKFNGSHIPGSPFKIRVGEVGQTGDPGMVSAYGPGLEGGVTGNPAEFIVNTTNAGPGALAVTIDGPSKVKMDCLECPEGYKVIYTPMAPGSYLISIKYGGPYHIAGSPFKAKITGKRPPGNNMLLVGVHGPKTPCEEIVVKHLGNRLYNVTYLLKDRGDYVLVVKWGDEHIPGSPFHISVP